MADEGIKKLGESLLGDQRKRNDQIYKQQRKEAYKLGLMQAGVSLINNSLKNKAVGFIQSEQAMAARAKQKRGYEDAQFYINQQSAIEGSGLSAVDYFTQQLLPTAREVAVETIREQDYDPDTYNTLIRQYTRELAQKKAEEHQKGFSLAGEIQSPEEFEKFQLMHATRMNSGFDWLASNVKALFGGKSKEQLDLETMDAIANSEYVTKAEAVSELRKAYSQIGDVNIAAKIAQAVEDGLIPRVERVVNYKAGNPLQVKGAFGEESWVMPIFAQDEGGNLIMRDGKPVILTHSLFGQGAGMSGGMAGVGAAPDMARVIESLNDGEKHSASMALTSVRNTLSGDEASALDLYLNKASIGRDGKVDPSITATNIAAWGKTLSYNFGVPHSDASKLSARVLVNRVTNAYNNPWYKGAELDFSSLNLNSEPDAVEIAQALADLEGTGNGIKYTLDQAQEMFSTLGQDWARYDQDARDRLIANMSKNPEKYPYFFEGPEGGRVIDVLAETNAIATRQEVHDWVQEQVEIEQSREKANDPQSWSLGSAENPDAVSFSTLLDGVRRWRTKGAQETESARNLQVAQETFDQFKSSEQTKADADKYLTWLYGEGYKEDPIETLLDEINSPTIGLIRSDDLPDDVAEARERLLTRLNEAQYSGTMGIIDTLKFAKHNTADLFTSPETYITAIGFLSGKGAPRSQIRPSNNTWSSGTTRVQEPPATTGVVDDAIDLATVRETRQSMAAGRIRQDEIAAENSFRSYLDPNRLVTKEDLTALLREAERRPYTGKNFGPRNPSPANKEKFEIQQEARSYLKSIYNREPTNKEVLKYLQDVYGGVNVGNYNVRF